MSWKRPNVEQRMLPLFEGITNSGVGYWLDGGSGDGAFSKIIKLKYPNIHVIRLDLKFSGKSKENFLISRIENLPLRKNSYEGIILGQILHYISPKIQLSLLTQLADFLEIGGTICLIEYEVSHSYPWIPYPVSYEKVSSLIQKKSSLVEVAYNRIQDGNRPKYSVVIGKKD